jgi:hypothetical protein
MKHVITDHAIELEQTYRIQKVESIESYYVSTDENYPEFSSLDSALKCFIDELQNLDPFEYDHLEHAYEEVFGDKPDDPEEFSDYFQYANVCVSFNLVYRDESILCVRFNFDVQENKLRIEEHSIEIDPQFEQPLEEIVETIKSLFKK